jgi:hypothetical protein
MIFEEFSGDIKAMLNGKTLAVGDVIEDAQWASVFVIGKGKVTFRDSPVSTVERAGTEPITEPITPIPASAPTLVPTPAPTPVPTQATPVVERVTPTVETPGQDTEA